jgi:hypothetical protein
MNEFDIPLKNEKIKSYKTSLVIIICLNLLAFLFLYFTIQDKITRDRCLTIAACIAISLVLDIYIKNKQRVDFRGAAMGLIIFAYFMLGYYWPGILMILISVLYLFATRKLTVYVSKQNILYPSIPKKKIQWAELNNIVLKDNILTIDLTNNKLIQYYTDQSSIQINEQEFNDFCTRQLAFESTKQVNGNVNTI